MKVNFTDVARSNPVNLNSMSYFEAVVRLGGVAKAADEMQVSVSAVSQQLRQLEQQLGVSLFHREKRRLALTIDGERLFQTTTTAFESIRDVRNAIMRQRESFHLSVRVSPSFGDCWLAPRLADFIRHNPRWEIRVDATPNFSDFATEVVDLDLRYGDGSWAGLHSSCVVNDLILPMCSPGYLAELRAISQDPREQLHQARLIDSAKAYFRWNTWLPRHGVAPSKPGFPYRFDRSSMSMRLAIEGAGVALESTTIALDALLSGQLVPLSPCFEAIEFPAYWMVCPHRHVSRRSVRLFTEWVAETGQEHTARARRFLTDLGFRFCLDPRPHLLPGA
ncbi:LysR substrate-binding domain-containing protein [Aureimonas phyllosphaerae]|uniref:LysR substrate-binding domain-containing protein n=1 Tax=Aureimonas phyllosphaerae TaxID=1166078 RepID=UPI001FCCC20F|nr:LysR substrate-binding domain-containing protein [Aureimonas phyllosphaerae]